MATIWIVGAAWPRDRCRLDPDVSDQRPVSRQTPARCIGTAPSAYASVCALLAANCDRGAKPSRKYGDSSSFEGDFGGSGAVGR